MDDWIGLDEGAFRRLAEARKASITSYMAALSFNMTLKREGQMFASANDLRGWYRATALAHGRILRPEHFSTSEIYRGF